MKVDYLAQAGLVGDYNLNGFVDAADYTVWRDTRDTSGVCLAADGTRDGNVNLADFAAWTQNFGNVTGGRFRRRWSPSRRGGWLRLALWPWPADVAGPLVATSTIRTAPNPDRERPGVPGSGAGRLSEFSHDTNDHSDYAGVPRVDRFHA